MARSECLSSVSTIADGIAVKKPGENTYAIVKKYVDEIALVSDDEVSSAILALIENQKMIAEGARRRSGSGGDVRQVDST
jgi:threonine dehydratase